MDEKVLEKRIDALSDGGKVAIVLCAGAFRFGGNWGFVRKNTSDYKARLEILKEERPQVKAIQVSNGALVTCSENFLAYNVNAVLPGAIGQPFVEMAKARRQGEKERFLKFLKGVHEGKCTYLEKKNGYSELTLGVYCINDTNLIRIGGTDYPAYKLTAIEVLDFARFLTREGRKVYVRAVTPEGKEVYDLVERLGVNSKGIEAVFRGLEIADSDTGAFMTLRIV